MPSEQVIIYCENCKKSQIHIKQLPNHILHLLLTVFTFGIWVIVWFFKSLFTNTNPVCSKCGFEKK